LLRLKSLFATQQSNESIGVPFPFASFRISSIF
jgi:hypothetical protein